MTADEIKRLREQVVVASGFTDLLMSPSDVLSLLDAAEENARLREALKPFAKIADGKDEWSPDDSCCRFPTMRQVRAARAALEGKP